MITALIVLTAIFLVPSFASFIWGVLCWTPGRLKIWAAVNASYVLFLCFPLLMADEVVSRVTGTLLKTHFFVLIPLAMVQLVVIAFLQHRRDENRRRSSESVRQLGHDLLTGKVAG